MSSTDIDIAEKSANFKITICGLTEQRINNKKPASDSRQYLVL